MDEVRTARSWVEFGRELRVWRRRAGYTQQQLGLRVGYHHSVISRLEGGFREPPPGLSRRLDDVLDTGGALTALTAHPAVRHHPSFLPPSDPTLFLAIPGVDTPDRIPAPRLPVWPTRLPDEGFECPLHGDVGCSVPTAADVLAMLDRLDRRSGADLPTEPVPELVHGLTAMLPGYTRATTEDVSTEIIGSIERVLHLVIGWAEAVNAAGRAPHSLLRLGAQYAQLAGRLRMQRGQSAVGMAWFGHGLRWAGACTDPVAQATLLSDFCTLTRLDRDASSSLAYARALAAVDPRRGWVEAVSYLYQARAYALGGDVVECERQVSRARRRLSRLDQRDQREAPWLIGDAGQVRAESAVAGALRDLSARTGDRTTARRAVHAGRRSLAHLPERMRPTYLLLTVRLADGYACAGEPDAAVAVAAPVVGEAVLSGRATILHEVRGLLARLTGRWGDLREVRDLVERLPASAPTPARAVACHGR